MNKKDKLKSSIPQDNYGDHYVDPMAQNLRTQGKGSRIIDFTGWLSDEVSQRLRRIYGKDESK